MSGSITEHHYDAHGTCTFVRFESSMDEAWVGVFGNGILPMHSAAMIFFNGCNVFVIAGGQGYIINAITREMLHKTEHDYLVSGITVPSRDFVIVSDFTEIFAYSVHDKIWNSERVALDGVDLQSSTSYELHGRIWDLDWYDFILHYDGWRFQQGSMSAKQD